MRQSNGDRIAIRLLVVAPSAEMAAPPVIIERDAPARGGNFTGLFAGLFVWHFQPVQGFFASFSVAFSARGSVDPFKFPSCSHDEFVDINIRYE